MFIRIFNSLGLNLSLNINEESSPIILFAYYFSIIFNFFICILNIYIFMYFYVSDNKVLLDKVSQYS